MPVPASGLSESTTTTSGVAPALAFGQYQFKDNGLLLNSDITSDFFDITQVAGMDPAEARVITNDLDGQHGAFSYAKYLKSKVVVLDMNAYSITSQYVLPLLDALATNWYVDDRYYPLYHNNGAGTRVIFGKSLGIKYPIDAQIAHKIAKVQAQLQCDDPRHYSLEVTTLNTNFPNIVSDGARFPFSFPLSFGATILGGVFNALNLGSMETEPIFRIKNKINVLKITNSATAQSITIPLGTKSGDEIYINCATGAILLNGKNIADDAVIENGMLFLVPGLNTISVSAVTADDSATAQMQFRSAWSQG